MITLTEFWKYIITLNVEQLVKQLQLRTNNVVDFHSIYFVPFNDAMPEHGNIHSMNFVQDSSAYILFAFKIKREIVLNELLALVFQVYFVLLPPFHLIGAHQVWTLERSALFLLKSKFDVSTIQFFHLNESHTFTEVSQWSHRAESARGKRIIRCS